MCIAILTTPGKSVNFDVLGRYFDANRDGAGFAYINPKDGKVEIDKGYFGKDQYLDKYKALLERGVHEKNPMLLHARIATQGKVNRDNCHPFRVRGGAMIHNGSFYWSAGREAEKSDTREIAERLHNELTYEVISVDVDKITKAMSYQKVAMIFEGGKYVILNEKGGTWQDGIWYSNAYQLNTSNNRYSFK